MLFFFKLAAFLRRRLSHIDASFKTMSISCKLDGVMESRTNAAVHYATTEARWIYLDFSNVSSASVQLLSQKLTREGLLVINTRSQACWTGRPKEAAADSTDSIQGKTEHGMAPLSSSWQAVYEMLKWKQGMERDRQKERERERRGKKGRRIMGNPHCHGATTISWHQRSDCTGSNIASHVSSRSPMAPPLPQDPFETRQPYRKQVVSDLKRPTRKGLSKARNMMHWSCSWWPHVAHWSSHKGFSLTTPVAGNWYLPQQFLIISNHLASTSLV